jgi:hypothetical protein
MQRGFGGDSAPQQSWKTVPTENVSFHAFSIHCCRCRRYISGRKHLLPKEARRVKFTGYLRCPIDGPKSWMRRRSNVARSDTKQPSGEYVRSEPEHRFGGALRFAVKRMPGERAAWKPYTRNRSGTGADRCTKIRK